MDFFKDIHKRAEQFRNDLSSLIAEDLDQPINTDHTISTDEIAAINSDRPGCSSHTDESAGIFKNNQGGFKRVHQGYGYNKHRIGRDGVVTWICCRKNTGCTATMRTSGLEGEPYALPEHCHEANPGLAMVLKAKKTLVDSAARASSTREVVEEVYETVPDNAQSLLPKRSALTRTVERRRREQNSLDFNTWFEAKLGRFAPNDASKLEQETYSPDQDFIVRDNQGGIQRIYCGYKYNKQKLLNGIVTWTCTYKPSGCTSFMRSNGIKGVPYGLGVHNHTRYCNLAGQEDEGTQSTVTLTRDAEEIASLPGSTPTTSAAGPVDLSEDDYIGTSARGNAKRIYRGYDYTKQRTSQGGVVTWRCSRRTDGAAWREGRCTCMATMKSQGIMGVPYDVMYHKNHDPVPNLALIQRAREAIRAQVSSESQTRDVVDDVLQSLPPDARAVFSVESLYRSTRRRRQHLRASAGGGEGVAETQQEVTGETDETPTSADTPVELGNGEQLAITAEPCSETPTTSTAISRPEEEDYLCRTNKGGYKRIYRGYDYNQNCSGRGDVVYWKCAHKRTCRATMRSLGLEATPVLGGKAHNHPPVANIVAIHKMKEFLRAKANTGAKVRHVVDEALESLPEELRATFPKAESLKRLIRNRRKRMSDGAARWFGRNQECPLPKDILAVEGTEECQEQGEQLGVFQAQDVRMGEEQGEQLGVFQPQAVRMGEEQGEQLGVFQPQAVRMGEEQGEQLGVFQPQAVRMGEEQGEQLGVFQPQAVRMGEEQGEQLGVFQAQDVRMGEEQGEQLGVFQPQAVRMGEEQGEQLGVFQPQAVRMGEEQGEQLGVFQAQDVRMGEEQGEQLGVFQAQDVRMGEDQGEQLGVFQAQDVRMGEEEQQGEQLGVFQAQDVRMGEDQGEQLGVFQAQDVRMGEEEQQGEQLGVLEAEDVKTGAEHSGNSQQQGQQLGEDYLPNQSSNVSDLPVAIKLEPGQIKQELEEEDVMNSSSVSFAVETLPESSSNGGDEDAYLDPGTDEDYIAHTARGGFKRIYCGYHYTRRRCTVSTDGVELVEWVCSRRSTGCNGSIKTRGVRGVPFKIGPHHHAHTPRLATIHRTKDAMMAGVSDLPPRSASGFVEQALQGVPLEVRRGLPSGASLKRQARRRRRMAQLAIGPAAGQDGDSISNG